MSGDGRPPFFDTNILVYLLQDGLRRSSIAEALLDQGGVISVQVLNEMLNVSRRKLRQTWDDVLPVISLVRRHVSVVPVTIDVHELGISLAQRYQLQIYDAMIVAAAALAGCETLYSEDMQHGQTLGTVRVVNPFLA